MITLISNVLHNPFPSFHGAYQDHMAAAEAAANYSHFIRESNLLIINSRPRICFNPVEGNWAQERIRDPKGVDERKRMRP